MHPVPGKTAHFDIMVRPTALQSWKPVMVQGLAKIFLEAIPAMPAAGNNVTTNGTYMNRPTKHKLNVSPQFLLSIPKRP